MRKATKAFDNVVFQLANTVHQLEAAEKAGCWRSVSVRLEKPAPEHGNPSAF
jgi:hypothetical protein